MLKPSFWLEYTENGDFVGRGGQNWSRESREEALRVTEARHEGDLASVVAVEERRGCFLGGKTHQGMVNVYKWTNLVLQRNGRLGITRLRFMCRLHVILAQTL